MRVLIISQYYPPEGAAAYYPSSLATELAKRGHDVRVLTGYPNYPSGRLFDGYRMKWRTREKDEHGVDVLRVPLYIDHSQSAARRILNYVTFGISAAGARRWSAGADVIYVYATQMTPALGPWLRSFVGGTPYVLHVQDLWPDSIVGSSIAPGPFKRIVESLLTPWLRSVYARAAAVIAIAPTMAATLRARGVSADKVHVVYNWGPGFSENRSVPSAHADSSTTRLLYAGNVGDMQDLETVVRASHAAQDVGVHLTIVGDGVALPKVRALADELGACNVSFMGRVPMEQTSGLYRDADFSLVTLKDLPTFRGTIPSKFQASLAQGKPVITTVQGDLRAFVEESGVGLVAEAEDVDSLAAAFRSAAQMTPDDRAEMSRAARNSYGDLFSIHAGVDVMEQILKGAVASAGATRSQEEKVGSK